MFKPVKLSREQAKQYFVSEFANSSNAYYAEDGKVNGYWQGQIAKDLQLGAVLQDEYGRMVDGQHPLTGEQIIRIRDTYKTQSGEETEHRAGWDLTWSLPKSFTLAATVGADKRLMQALRETNTEVLAIMERLTVQGHGGGHHWNTGRWLVATFEHDSARPVDGRPDPQVHFHNVVANMTYGEDGKWHSIDPREIYKAQTLGTALGHWIAAAKARDLGYEIVIGKSGNPELAGFDTEYLEATSRRRELIEQGMKERGISGARAAELIALSLREEKISLTPEQWRTLMDGLDEAFGNQAKQAVAESRERGRTYHQDAANAEEAVNWGKRRMAERTMVFDHFELMREAVKYAEGTVSPMDIEVNIAEQVERGDLVERQHVRQNAPGARYATKQAMALERDVIRREVIGRMLEGQGGVQPAIQTADLGAYWELKDNPARRQILESVLTSRDQTLAIDGVPGSAKSTSARILNEQLTQAGWLVRAMAPTGTAADALREKGLSADTLQRHLKTYRKTVDNSYLPTDKVFYILDEASLVSAKQMGKFYKTVRPQDHVLLIGDDSPKRAVGQHTSVEAGRIFQEMQEAGMKTAQFNKIYRQKTEEQRLVVLLWNHGKTEAAISMLDQQGRIHEHPNRTERFAALAADYASSPKGTLAISPDNDSKLELSLAIREAQQKAGNVSRKETETSVLVSKDLTKPEMERAWAYRQGDVILYLHGNKDLQLAAKAYATVIEVQSQASTRTNLLKVKTEEGRILTYDPSQVKDVSVYESRQQAFSAGDRIQFTGRWQQKKIRTRDLGTITDLDEHGNAKVTMDNKGRTVALNLKDFRHLDYGYVMTSQSAQSKTVTRTLIHVETMDTRLRGLHNQVFAKVAGSRHEQGVAFYVDSKLDLARELGRPLEKHKALSPEEIERAGNKRQAPAQQQAMAAAAPAQAPVQQQAPSPVVQMPPPAQPAPSVTVTVKPWVNDDKLWRDRISELITSAYEIHGSDVLGAITPSARKLLAGERRVILAAGIEAPAYTDRQQAMVEMHRLAMQSYQSNLFGEAGKEARAYLESRGINRALMEEFGLGYSKRAGNEITGMARAFGSELAESSSLVNKSEENGQYYDYFRGRIMFPTMDAAGNPVGFGARQFETSSGPKYLNSRNTEIYQKGELLYNFDRAQSAARDEGRMILVEGYTDVIMAHGAGVQNIVAPNGTALSETQAQMLRSVSSEVVFGLDPDAAGARATIKHMPGLFRAGLDIRGINLGSEDPAEFIRRNGAEAFREQLKAPMILPEVIGVVGAVSIPGKEAENEVDRLKLAVDILSEVPPERRENVSAVMALYLQRPAQERIAEINAAAQNEINRNDISV